MSETSTDQELYVAQVVEDGTEEVVFESKPTYRRRAEKIEDGLGINLNWSKFSTRVVSAPGTGCGDDAV